MQPPPPSQVSHLRRLCLPAKGVQSRDNSNSESPSRREGKLITSPVGGNSHRSASRCTHAHTHHIPLGGKEAHGRDPLEKVSFIIQLLWACHRMVSGEYRLVVCSRDVYPSKRLWVTDFGMCCVPWDAPAWRISPRCYCSASSREEGIDTQRGKSSFLSESPLSLKGWSLCRLHFVGGTDTTCHRWALSLSLGPERH